jgi:iron complex outermembrane receptor protein
MKSSYGFSLKGGASVAAVVCLLHAPSRAAETTDTKSAQGAENGLEEIVVTATRRAENLQNVPIAVTSLNETQLERIGISDTLDVAQVTPGLQLRQSAGEILPSIRGIGSQVFGPGVENPVAVYVDGVYLESSPSLNTSLANIDRIEVLKGPQGTLFGRNSTGGLMQIVTAAPSHDFSGKASVNFGNYETGGGDLYVTGGLSDTLAANVALHYEGQGQGYGRNVYNGRDVNQNTDDVAVRTKLLWEPDTLTSATLAVSYSFQENSSLLALGVNPGDSTYANLYHNVFGRPALNFGGFYDVNANVDPLAIITTWMVSLEVKHDLGFADLKSITAAQGVEFRENFKLDQVPYTLVDFHRSAVISHPVSEELQLSSKQGGHLKWTTGLFIFHSTDSWSPFHVQFGQDGSSLFFNLPVSPIDEIISDKMITNSYAAYGQGTYELFQATRLTLGVRYTHETRQVSGVEDFLIPGFPASISPEPAPGTGIPSQLDFNNVSFRVGIDHDFLENLMGYSSFSTGFKSGGYNLSVPSNSPFLPEKIGAWEVGFKSELFDRKVRLNPAVYYYDYKNIQVGSYTGVNQIAYNGATAEIYGADMDAQLRASQDVILSAGISYIHGRFTDFPKADYTFVVPDCDYSAPNPARVCQASAAGNRIPNTPDYSANVGLNWSHDFNFGNVDLNSNLYQSGAWFGTVDNNPHVRQASYHLLNASLSWTPVGGPYTLRLWGRNITGSKVVNDLYQSAGGLAHTVNPPATYGIWAEAKF